MGKKNKKKTKWLPLNIENQAENKDGSQDSSSHTETVCNSPEKQYSNSISMNSIDENEMQPSCTPSGSYYPLMTHPVYMAFPLPRVYHPNFVSQNSYRPLQPLDWFNQRIPANCQIYHAMAPQVPKYLRPRTGYQNPFYWNSVLINPYSNFTTSQINPENYSSGYTYPGHYYGPASLSSVHANDVTAKQRTEDNNTNTSTGERRIQSKKRKRKRKRKLHLQTTPPSSLGDESISCSDLQRIELSLMDDEMESAEIEQDNTGSEQAAALLVGEMHMSRDRLPRLPLVDDLFAVSLVDEIVSKAIEIALEREEKVTNLILVDENEKELEDLKFEDDCVDEDEDEEEDLEVSQLLMGIDIIKDVDNGRSASNVFNPVNVDNREIGVDEEENVVENDDNVMDEINENDPSLRNEMNNAQVPVEFDWTDKNGHTQDDEDDDGERELVTEIVFISETSFMDESHAAENGENGENFENFENFENTETQHDVDVDNNDVDIDDKESELTESDDNCSKTSFEDNVEEEEEFVGETYMDIGDHQQFYDPHKVKDYYQICTNMDVPDSPLEKSEKSCQPVFDVVTTQPLPSYTKVTKMVPRQESEPKELPNRHAEIVVHEMDDDVSECGSEDVDTIGHRYQKSETVKNIYVNQLSLAAELLRAQQDIPYDKEFKPIENDVKCLQETATTSHSNRQVYEKFYGNLSEIEMGSVGTTQPESCKEVRDSGVQSEESGDEDESKAQGAANRSAYKGVLGANAKPLSSMLKGKGDTDPLCLCCSLM